MTAAARRRLTAAIAGILVVAGTLGVIEANRPVARCQRAVDLCFFNTTQSMPVGWYRALPLGRPFPGEPVLFCLRGRALDEAIRLGAVRRTTGPCERGYEPLLKMIVAVTGDVVVETPKGVRVDGRLLPGSVPQKRSLRGIPAHLIAYGTHRLARDEVWVATTNPRSYDSRYYGPVPVGTILYRADLIRDD